MSEHPGENAAQLGIKGLPPQVGGLLPGGMYLLVAETATTRFPLLAANLAATLGHEVPCTVVLPHNPEAFIERIGAFGVVSLVDAYARNQVRLYLMQEEFPKKMFRQGADRFVAELDHYQIPENSYLLFDQADDVLALHDATLAANQVREIGSWARRKAVTILVVLTCLTEGQHTTINALMDDLAGVVRLTADRSGLTLAFDYWQSPKGSTAARHFLLSTLGSGLYEANETRGAVASAVAAPAEEAVLEPAASEMPYFFMDPELTAWVRKSPGRWTHVPSLVSLMHATRNLKVAYCLLVYEPGTDIRDIAQAVHTLRVNMGRHARIVVQQKGGSLRKSGEMLLLRLGANIILRKDAAFNEIASTLASLKGQVFGQDLALDFETAFQSAVNPSQLSGYIPPAVFVREVRAILERTADLDVPAVLVALQPVAPLTVETVVAEHGITRFGDLLTTSHQDCWLYLHACQEFEAPKALDRLLKHEVDRFFINVRFFVTATEIELELAALERLSQRENLPDFSHLRPAVVASAPSASPPSAGTRAVGATGITRTAEPEFAARPSTGPQPGVHAAPREDAVFAPPTGPGPTPSREPNAPPALPEIADSFQYDGVSNVRVFGRSLAPRAKRAATQSSS